MHAFRTCGPRVVVVEKLESGNTRGLLFSISRKVFFLNLPEYRRLNRLYLFLFFFSFLFFLLSLLNWRLECYGVCWKFRWNGENETLIRY